MKRNIARLCVPLCAIAIAACSKNSAAPTAPVAATDASAAAANADGTTLKATPPTPVAPANGQKLDLSATTGVEVVVANARSTYNVGLPVSYRFEIFNSSNTKIEEAVGVPAGATHTSYTIQAPLDPDRTYTWRARAEVNQGQYVGTWTPTWSFISPQSEGYIVGNELYDPLANGKTVGAISGSVDFIPGGGIHIGNHLSYVTYVLPQTLTQGEFSMLVTDMPGNTDGDKTKVFAMAEGFGDIVTNNRRMTIEKRGEPPGIVAWRVISHMLQIDTEGPEREFVQFDADKTYFFQATWRSNVFRLIIRSGGVDGQQVYNKAKNYDPGNTYGGNAYDPVPHVAYLGSPVGRSGESGASVNGMTIRQVWISGRPRPAFAKN